MTDYYLVAQKIVSKHATPYQKLVIGRDDMNLSKIVDAMIAADNSYDSNQLSSPETWRWKAAMIAIRNVSKMKKCKFYPLSTLSTVQKDVLSKNAIYEHDDIVEASDNVELVNNLILNTPLTKLEKRYLRSYYFEGKNTKEIGNLNGCSKQAVQQRLQAAVVKLRKTANKNNIEWVQ